MRRIAIYSLTALLLTGCVSSNPRSGAGNAVTSKKPETATIQYWVDQPARTTVKANDYDQLWNACDRVAIRYLFAIDRTDYREGLLTTKPLISKYFVEFWRNDVQFSEDLAQSSIATYRRTIRFEIHKSDDGRFEAAVKVIVERSSAFEHRVTTAIQYRDAFGAFPLGTEFFDDEGVKQSQQSWYAVGRDTALEVELGKKIQNALK